MIVQSLYIVVVASIFRITFALNRGDECTTPNNQKATCIAIQDCTVIFQAISSRNTSAVEFAQKSQCGYDSRPLVCCGTSAYFTSTESSDIFNIFTKPPPVTPKPRPPPNPGLQNVILLNFETKALPDRTVCGLEKEEQRVLGGEIADLDEFPWMVALEYTSKINGDDVGVKCGGSIINNRFILTAAHCIINKEFKLSFVRLGEWRISEDPDCIELVANIECADKVVKVAIKEEIPHPYYSKRSGNNDIGLLKLEKDIQYTDYIRPICLPPANLPNPDVLTPMTVAGWGLTENGTSSDEKRKVDVPLLSNRACNSKLNKPISPNQLCAGGEQGKDSCQGDSGGPLMRPFQDAINKQSQWYQEGVVSSGVGCARAGYPAIYTRVSRYVSWIINNISEE